MSTELSVLIATHERRDLILRCLDGLASQAVDAGSFEVIVGDDGSTDGTANAVEAFAAPFALKLLRLEKSGQAKAQNACLEVASGRICLVLDDDVMPDPGLVGEHLAAHAGSDPVLAIGRLMQRRARRRDWYAHAFAASWNRHFDEREAGPADWSACYGANFSARSDGLRAIGGFPTDLPVGEDAVLAYRLQDCGHQPVYVPGALVIHDDQKGRHRLIEDSLRQGRGNVELAQLHPRMLATMLGWFGATTGREIALRRVLLALRASPQMLAALGGLLPGVGRKEIWFQFVSRYAFWRGVRSQVDRGRWQQLTRGVPVLMYHAFGERDEGDRYVVSRRQLGRQLRLLKLFGFRTIGLSELVAASREGRLPPRNSIVITIDDGYADNFEVALPLLRRHGAEATIFLLSDRFGAVNDWTDEGALAKRPLLALEQVLADGGDRLTYGAHTRSHADLEAAGDDEVVDQVASSRERLERDLGRRVTTFAYPFGRFDERAVDAVREAGYDGACTVEPRLAGLAEDPMRIPRLEVRSTDSLVRFSLKLWFGGS
ncbi:MAG: polysaccharide deacetylase family protein [Solirubrobacterales bacterium]|nr:polysaccharide deacetylase family protein [Solirubrobacterales bacterium]